MENKILYSEQAYKDGYDFSSLSLPEQIATKNLYTNKEDMWQMGRLRRAADYYMRNIHTDSTLEPLIETTWYFREAEVIVL